MEKYVKYLLSDIAAATQNVPVYMMEEPDEEMPFITVEEEEKTARWESLGSWIKIKQEWFPPVNRLSESQISRIVAAMHRCLYAFGYIPHFPTGLPIDKQYEVLVDYLNKQVPILIYNSYQLDFCGYEPKSCPFGKQYCQCKVYERWLTRFEEDDDDLFEGLVEEPPLSSFYLDEDDESHQEDSLGSWEDDLNYIYDDDFWDDEEDDDDFLSDLTDMDFGPDDGRLN